MKFSNAAIGLAAVGAGFLVARALKARRAGDTAYVGGHSGGAPEPPEPSRLIGQPLSNRSARKAAEAFGDQPTRLM